MSAWDNLFTPHSFSEREQPLLWVSFTEEMPVNFHALKDDHVGMREALYSWCLGKIVVGMSKIGTLTVHLESEKCHNSAVYFQISKLSDRKVKL